MERLSCLFETIFVTGKLAPLLLKIVKICFTMPTEVGHNNPLLIKNRRCWIRPSWDVERAAGAGALQEARRDPCGA